MEEQEGRRTVAAPRAPFACPEASTERPPPRLLSRTLHRGCRSRPAPCPESGQEVAVRPGDDERTPQPRESVPANLPGEGRRRHVVLRAVGSHRLDPRGMRPGSNPLAARAPWRARRRPGNVVGSGTAADSADSPPGARRTGAPSILQISSASSISGSSDVGGLRTRCSGRGPSSQPSHLRASRRPPQGTRATSFTRRAFSSAAAQPGPVPKTIAAVGVPTLPIGGRPGYGRLDRVSRRAPVPSGQVW